MLLLSPLSLLLLSLWSLLSLLLLLLLLSSSVLLLSLRSWLSLPLWSLLSLLLNEKRLRSHAGGLLLGGRPEGVAERRAHRGGAKSSSSCKDQQCLCTAGACVIFKTVPLPVLPLPPLSPRAVPLPALPLPALSLKTVPALPQVLVQLFSSVRSFRMTLKGYVNMEAQMTYVERVFQYIDLPVVTPPPANINHPLEEPTAPALSPPILRSLAYSSRSLAYSPRLKSLQPPARSQLLIGAPACPQP